MNGESEFLIRAAKDWIKSIFGDDLDSSVLLKIATHFSDCIDEPIENRYRYKKSMIYLWIGLHFPELRKVSRECPISVDYKSQKSLIQISEPPVLLYGSRRI